MADITVLFARKDSIYKTFLNCDVYDIDRDALNFTGDNPVVAHPPCRAWGKLSHLANPRPGERELAFFALEKVRKNGGILEHPAHSKLWPEKKLPLPNTMDKFGGWTLPIYQCNWGHTCVKPTLLYICGITPYQMLPMPIIPGTKALILGSHSRRKDGTRKQPGEYGYREQCYRPDREKTPLALAEYLVENVRRINYMQRQISELFHGYECKL